MTIISVMITVYYRDLLVLLWEWLIFYQFSITVKFHRMSFNVKASTKFISIDS